MKKTGVALLTTALVSSQLIAAVPFNVFAAEATPQMTLQATETSKNMLQNPEFVGNTGWTGWNWIKAYSPSQKFNGITFNGNGSVNISPTTVGPNGLKRFYYLQQAFETKPNGVYTLKATTNNVDITITDGDVHSPKQAATVISQNKSNGTITFKATSSLTTINMSTENYGTSITSASVSNLSITELQLDQLTIDQPLTTKDTVITGTGYPGHKVFFWPGEQLAVDNRALYDDIINNWVVGHHTEATIGADGKYSITLPSTLPLNADYRVYYVTGENRVEEGDDTNPLALVDPNGTPYEAMSAVIAAPSNDKPVISGAVNKSIKAGTSFDPKAGVTATDTEDGNLTSAIQVSGTVNTNVPGSYPITYTVKDSDGNTTTKTITVTVTSNDKPVISGAVNKTITQGTSFDPKAGVTATDTEDGNLTSAIQVSGTVNTNVPGSYPITYSVKDSDGNTTTKSITITVQAKATQGTVTANDFNIGKDSYITGTYTGDVKKLSVIVNGKTLSTINVSGSPYKYYAGKNITGVNDVVQVVGYDADGKELSRATVTVKKEIITEGTITANNFVIGKDGYVKGNTTGDVAKISMIVNGKEFSRINATAGAYQYYAGGKILTDNDAVTMVAYDAKGKELDRANVAVSKDDAPEVGTITTNTFTIGQDGYVTGTFTGKAARLGLLINGQELSRINVTTSPFKYYVGSKIASTNDDVTAVLYDAKGREMARSNVTLKKAEPVTSGTVAADAFQVGGTDAYIHGTTTGDVVKVKLSVNGTIISQRAVNADGSYDYYARPSITSTNDVVYMIGYDAKGKELNRVKVALTSAKGTVSASPYTVGGADRYLHGTATGDVAKVQVYINGQQDSLTVVKADGTFQYYLGSKVSSTNDKVELVGLSSNGQELDRVAVTLN
ncbi:DUF5011 domain-containing protein [Listeria fleischmannii]|uniref:Glycoside hydrolase family 18 n=1 Tax=Listeria fleischmannii FSL S10-1203 TaxID=1265822 RepID=W7DKK9_9LIST|nr:DUF5011 domain-containing protein [Listeria fleischmannii]EUJ52486.1 glycoside hydrolase family 18 [Listeria fleischmannii FSL S10-1203]